MNYVSGIDLCNSPIIAELQTCGNPPTNNFLSSSSGTSSDVSILSAIVSNYFLSEKICTWSVLRDPVSVCLVPLDSNPRCVYSSTRFQNISIDSRHTLHLQQLDHNENVHVACGEERTKTLTRKCCKLRVKYLALRERMFLFLGRLGWRAGSGSCAASKMAGGHVTRSASRRSSAGQ